MSVYFQVERREEFVDARGGDLAGRSDYDHLIETIVDEVDSGHVDPALNRSLFLTSFDLKVDRQ